MQKIKYKQIPNDILKEINDANIEDILDRYNDADYHDPQITFEILKEHNLILIDDNGDTITPYPEESRILTNK